MFSIDVWKKGALWLPLFLFLAGTNALSYELSKEDFTRIGELIFQNECASKISCLTSWNEGEDFASLGIGHFIWYPERVNESDRNFDESFPKLLAWMKKEGTPLPSWLSKQHSNPWKNKQHFKTLESTPQMQALRNFLFRSRDTQISFMKNRLRHALPRILKHLPLGRHAHIKQQFQYVADSPMGYYALIDYVNFKGEGIKLSERYQGLGWGLLQVLEHMQSTQPGLQAIQDFSDSADYILTRRVNLSPLARHESRWLAGWRKRLRTYKDEAQKLALQ